MSSASAGSPTRLRMKLPSRDRSRTTTSLISLSLSVIGMCWRCHDSVDVPDPEILWPFKRGPLAGLAYAFSNPSTPLYVSPARALGTSLDGRGFLYYF